jgi:hypothetical protein
LALSCTAALGGEAVAPGADLKSAPANTWVRLDDCATGGRNSPIFFYEPTLRQCVLAGGTPGGSYGSAKRHFDVEVFDLETRTWTNAYPPGAPYKNESGPTDAPAISSDGLKTLIPKDANGVSRFAMFGAAYGTDSRAHFQWAYDPDSRRLVGYLWNRTLTYDPAARGWQDTGAAPFSKGPFAMVWGNMCYDPVNKEVLSIGGSSEEPGGTPGTYVYKVAENAWKKVDVGSKEQYERAVALRRQAWALLSACRSRFLVTESAAEAKADLTAQAAALNAAIKPLLDDVMAFRADGSEARQRAADRLLFAQTKLAALAPKLAAPIAPDLIAEVKAAHDDLEGAELGLAVEPTGRAHAQPACDVKNGKIVLFGGSGLDRCYADTWVYDLKTRRWEQRFPRVSPSPRAGHALVYLPKSGKIALVGGYTIDGWFRSVPHQVWLYDVAKNEWSVALSLPGGARGGESAGAPRGGVGGNYAGGGSPWAALATPDDTLVAVDTFAAGRATWALKVDPAKTDGNAAAALGVPPGAMTFAHQPAQWEKDADPDAEKTQAFLKDLPLNTWTPLKPPKPVDHRAWNTTAYDPDRHQFLWWGGGHVTYMGTDVAHYSVRTNRWTLGYAPDLPTEPTGGFYVKAALSFQDRPQVPVHAYQAYAYDPPSGRMFYLDRAYNVAERQWDPLPYPGLRHRGCMNTMLESTPDGVVSIAEPGIFRFDWKDKAWKQLPWKGPVGTSAWCDGNALCYDSKRDCLWYATRDIYQYDLKTGVVEKAPVARPKRLGEWALWREQVYVPDADLILLMQLFPAPNGRETNVAFAPAENKYYAIDLLGAPKADRWTAAIHYDPTLNLVLIHDGRSNVYALRFDRKTATMTEITE